jgi:hypothetical protein
MVGGQDDGPTGEAVERVTRLAVQYPDVEISVPPTEQFGMPDVDSVNGGKDQCGQIVDRPFPRSGRGGRLDAGLGAIDGGAGARGAGAMDDLQSEDEALQTKRPDDGDGLQ